MKTLTFASFQFLFSAYIPYGKGKYLNQTFFLPSTNFIFNFKAVTHRIQLTSIYLGAMCICGDFWSFLGMTKMTT